MTAPRRGRVVFLVKFARSVPDEMSASVERVRAAGYEVDVREARGYLSEDELRRILPGAIGCITGNHHFTPAVIDASRGLRVISRTGAGLELIDLRHCTARDVVVTNASGSNAAAVAEFTVALMLAVARRLTFAERAMRAGAWTTNTDLSGRSVVGKTLGIIGFGNIGQELARLVGGFRMPTLYYDVRRREDLEGAMGVSYRSVDEILRVSDFISLNVALTPETRHLVGREALAKMKPTAYLVNTSRGGVIDEAALFEVLRNGLIGGAALDVFESEPIQLGNPLLGLDADFVGTPHIAGLSHEAEAAMLRVATQNLLDVLDGGRPAAVINPEVFS